MSNKSRQLKIKTAQLDIELDNDALKSLGAVRVHDTDLRNPENRFLPWFDSYDGEVFSEFKLQSIESEEGKTIIHTTAVSNQDYPFRERRDSSGDICLRPQSWDADPVTADFRIVIEPAETSIESYDFTGFRYWFEYESDSVPIHRMMDRQTWELGGELDDVTLLCRCLFDLPRKCMGPDTAFSTVGLEKSAGALPGNLWGRWSMIIPFDMQYSDDGVLVGWFDRVSNIRTVVESRPGENWIRYVDLHYFENSQTVATNPKTILYCPAQLDDVDATNLWTRIYDREKRKAWEQFGIVDDGPPRVSWHHGIWSGIDFDTSFEKGIEKASELGVEQMCIGAVWESSLSFTNNLHRLTSEDDREKTELDKRSSQSTGHKLHVLDYEVAEAYGGEEALTKLVQRANDQDVDIITWAKFAPGVTSYLTDRKDDLGGGLAGIYNAKESGRHPDSGYPFHTCSVNLHEPIRDYIKDHITGAMERTGIDGFLWDSFSNMGWWQVNYSDGTMRPQCEKMGRLYAELSNAGYYLQPEAIVSFSNHTAVGQHGGNIFYDDLSAFAYNSALGLYIVEHTADGPERRFVLNEILRGEEPFDTLFRCYAHKRIPPIGSHTFLEDKESILPERVQQLKDLIATYKKVRSKMQTRTILKEDRGVIWSDETDTCVLFCCKGQPWDGQAVEALTEEPVKTKGLAANRVYLVSQQAVANNSDEV